MVRVAGEVRTQGDPRCHLGSVQPPITFLAIENTSNFLHPMPKKAPLVRAKYEALPRDLTPTERAQPAKVVAAAP